MSKLPWLKNWDRGTAWLHLGLAITVTMQLMLSLVMDTPKADHPNGLPQTLFSIHMYVGMAAFIIVLFHWFWVYFYQERQVLHHLFPWTRAGLHNVLLNIKGLMKRQLPLGGAREGLPGFIHGLGLLAVTAMAFSGAVIFIFYPATGWLGQVLHADKEFHQFIATFVWAYWWGHIVMATAHYFDERRTATSTE
jgi:cytochrome b561